VLHPGLYGGGRIAAAPGLLTGVSLTGPDRRLLEFASEHRFVLPAQVGALLAESPEKVCARLGELRDAGYLIEEAVLAGQPLTYRCSRLGVEAVGSDLRPLPVSLAGYRHDVGAAWLWLAALNGAFGPMRDIIGERLLRSRDAKHRDAEHPLGVRLGGLGPKGRERLHYPDLVLVDLAGRRIAVELELSSKDPARRDRILSGYAADVRIAKVLYVVYTPQAARAVGASVKRLGITSLVSIQRVTPPDVERPVANRGKTAARPALREVVEMGR
jgi:hypothetical protein